MEANGKRLASTITLFALLFVFAYLGYSYTRPVPTGLQLTFFDVGQGDAALAVTPSGQSILIDGGPNDSVVAKLDQETPFYNHKLDAVVVTHPHADHIAGLVAVAKKYQIGKVYMSGVTHTAPEYLAFLEVLQKQNVPIQIVKSGDSLDFGSGIRLDILFPLTSMQDQTVENLNNSSVVTRISWGTTSAIMMGDLESEGQDQLLASKQMLKSDIIKISHHGSKDSVNASFLSAVDPKYAVISVGKDNKFGHPSRDMLDALMGRIVYRTDYDGDIHFDLTDTVVSASQK